MGFGKVGGERGVRHLEHHVRLRERIGADRLGARHQRHQRAAGGVRQRAGEGEQPVVDGGIHVDQNVAHQLTRAPCSRSTATICAATSSASPSSIVAPPCSSGRASETSRDARGRRLDADVERLGRRLGHRLAQAAHRDVARRRAGGLHADHGGQLQAQHGEPAAGVLLHDARGAVGHGDADDDVGLRPAERDGEARRRLAEHVGRASARRSGRGRAPARGTPRRRRAPRSASRRGRSRPPRRPRPGRHRARTRRAGPARCLPPAAPRR